MPHFPAPVRRFLVSCSTAALLLVAAAGCRSARSAYQFQPAPTGVTVARPFPVAQLLPDKIPAPAAVRAIASAVRPVTAPPARRRVRLATPLRPIQQLASTGQAAYAAARPVRRGAALTDGAQATTEAGLGTTVLGVLGLIVGPISLIGLLIWGGPVWAGLLGLSALAVLVAYLDPFG